jgi:hypothetical protein
VVHDSLCSHDGSSTAMAVILQCQCLVPESTVGADLPRDCAHALYAMAGLPQAPISNWIPAARAAAVEHAKLANLTCPPQALHYVGDIPAHPQPSFAKLRLSWKRPYCVILRSLTPLFLPGSNVTLISLTLLFFTCSNATLISLTHCFLFQRHSHIPDAIASGVFQCRR